jgi:hypothetical protein
VKMVTHAGSRGGFSQTAIDAYRGLYHRARIRVTRWLRPSL